MTGNAIHTLREHWETLQDGQELPLRSAVDPREMPDVLDSLFILERLNPDDIRVRIAGLTLCEMMGVEVRGQSPSTFFSQGTRTRFMAVVSDVMDRPTIARLGLDTVDDLGNEGISEMILLPLRSDFGDVNRVIGCIEVPETTFKAPVRFHISSIDMETISLDAPLNPASVYGFAEPKTGFIMDGNSALRAITGGRKDSSRPISKPDYLKVVD